MRVSTSYFAKQMYNPNALAISNSAPKEYTGKICKLLAPDWEDVAHYKKTGDNKPLIEHYKDKLDKLGFDRVKLLIPDGAVLLCWEKSSDFCHRHLLASFLREHGVSIVKEE